MSCCGIPVNVGDPRTVDAVENTADADCQPCRLKQIITYAVLYADAWRTCPRCVLYGEQDRSLSPTQDASAAPVTLRLRGRRRFKMSYI